jgi:hypothetical protein
MANGPRTAGVYSYALYKAETTYGTEVTPDTHFGLVNNFSRRFTNNLNNRRSFKGSSTSGRDIQQYVAGKSGIEITVDFDLNSEGIFTHILGTKADSTSTYSGDDLPSSMTISHSIDNDTTDRAEIYTGCVVNSATIKGAEGEPITITTNILSADMSYDDTLTSNASLPTTKVFTFSEATFELPNGTTIDNIVNEFEININNNMTLHFGNSRTATAYTAGAREYSLRLNTKYVDDELLNKALGGSSVSSDKPTINATMKIVLTNPDDDTITLLFGLSPINTHNLIASLNDPIGEEIELIPASLEITTSIS